MAKGKKDTKSAGTDLVPADDAAGGKKGKKGKGKGGKGAGAPKQSKVPRPVHSRAFAWVGLLLQVPIALMLLQDQLTIEAAAQRSAFVLVGVMLIERVLAPLLMTVIDPKHDEPQPTAGAADGSSPAVESERV